MDDKDLRALETAPTVTPFVLPQTSTVSEAEIEAAGQTMRAGLARAALGDAGHVLAALADTVGTQEWFDDLSLRDVRPSTPEFADARVVEQPDFDRATGAFDGKTRDLISE